MVGAAGQVVHREASLRLTLVDGTVLNDTQVMPPSARTGRTADLDLRLIELALMALDDGAYLARLQSHFGAGYGWRAGQLTAFGMLELRLAGDLQSTALGLGPRLGFAYPDRSGLTLTGAIGRQRFIDGGQTVDSMEIAAGLPLDADHTVVSELMLTRGDGIPSTRSLILGLRRYF